MPVEFCSENYSHQSENALSTAALGFLKAAVCVLPVVIGGLLECSLPSWGILQLNQGSSKGQDELHTPNQLGDFPPM